MTKAKKSVQNTVVEARDPYSLHRIYSRAELTKVRRSTFALGVWRWLVIVR